MHVIIVACQNSKIKHSKWWHNQSWYEKKCQISDRLTTVLLLTAFFFHIMLTVFRFSKIPQALNYNLYPGLKWISAFWKKKRTLEESICSATHWKIPMISSKYSSLQYLTKCDFVVVYNPDWGITVNVCLFTNLIWNIYSIFFLEMISVIKVHISQNIFWTIVHIFGKWSQKATWQSEKTLRSKMCEQEADMDLLTDWMLYR